MNRLLLMRIVSIIHFLKCARTAEFSRAEASFEHCSYLKGFIKLGLDEDEEQITHRIELYMQDNPSVAKQEINKYLGQPLTF